MTQLSAAASGSQPTGTTSHTTRVLSCIADIAGAPLPDLHPDMRLCDIHGWDSFSLLEFMTATDEQLGLELEPEALAQCTTVEDLVTLVSQQAANRTHQL